MPTDSEPIVESVCPTWRRTKSRFLRSGTRVTRETRRSARVSCSQSDGAKDAEVAADRLAADDERGSLADEAGVARERDLGGEVARDGAGIDVKVRAGCDADLDV